MCPSREWMTYSRRFAKMPSIRPSEVTSAIVPNTTLAIVSAVRRRFRPTLRKAIRKYMANCRMDMFFSLALRHDAVGDRDCTFRVAHHLRIVRRDEERGMFGLVQPVHQRQDLVAAGDMHLAPARPIERAEHVEQGRFAGARGADEHREIALAQRQVDGVQRLDARALLGLVNLGHTGEARDRRRRQWRAFDVCKCGERRFSNDLRRRRGHARFHSISSLTFSPSRLYSY